MKATLRPTMIILLAATCLTAPARAEDVHPAVAAILKTWEAQLDAKPTYEKIEADSSGNVTISNLTAAVGGRDPSTSIKLSIGSITLENVAAEADGMIDVGAASFNDTKLEFSAANKTAILVEVPKGTAEHWYVPVAGDNPTPRQAFRASMSIARKMTSGEIKVTADGQTFSARGVETFWDGDPVTGAGKSMVSFNDIVIPEAAIAMMDPSGQMKALGYGDLTFNVTGTGEFSVTEGNFGMSGNVSFAGKDMAGLTLSYGANDVPMAVMVELQAAQKSGRQPDMNMLMPQLMNVSLSNLQIRFDDASITKKVLPLIAKMQGMDEAAMVANAGAMMQLSLMQLKSQVFTDQVVAAVNTFLKDPKSITVSLKPAAPVKVQQLMMLDPTNPGAAIDLLGLSVTAND